MPINGLTNVPKSFLKLGQIRKGQKDKDGRPIDLDYFRVTFHPQETECAELFKATYGEEPRRINIRLAFPDVADVFDANYECYSKGGMIAKAASNDEKAWWVFFRDHDTGEVLVRNSMPVGERGRELFEKPIDLDAPIYSYKNKKNETVNAFLEPVGRLNVVVPELASLRVGFMEFRATSTKDISAIARELAGIDHMARLAGKDITGIPMVLTRREEEITKNINGQLSRGDSWMVHIEVGGEWGGRALEAIERRALPDVVDAEVVETEDWGPDPYVDPPMPEEPIEVAPAPKKSERPYSPEALREYIQELVKKHKDTAVPDKAGNILASTLDSTLGGDKSLRYTLCRVLLGIKNGSTKTLKGAQINALLEWQGVSDFGDMPSDIVIKETRDAATYALRMEGQEGLPGI